MHVIKWSVWKDLFLVIAKGNVIEGVHADSESAKAYADQLDDEFGDSSPYYVMRNGSIVSTSNKRGFPSWLPQGKTETAQSGSR